MLDQFFSSLSFVDIFNFCVFLVFSICYVYQIFYVFVTLTKKPPATDGEEESSLCGYRCRA